jgi:hypothetical protein
VAAEIVHDHDVARRKLGDQNPVDMALETASRAISNHLDVPPGWSFLMRIYRPGPTVLNSFHSPQT